MSGLADGPARLELRGVVRTYRGGVVAVDRVDLDVAGGELFVVVGPSGSGKSTLLRLIAGLEGLDAGSIHLGGRRIDGLPPRDRGLALVFQDAVAYPHLDVFDNIAFGLRARKTPRAEVRARVEAAAESTGIADLLGRSPATLSGGQRRRVALARALATRPRLLLLDEPFAGLDAPLRAAIRAEIVALHRRSGATTVLVTHDQAEALALADRLAVLDAGRVAQVGPPRQVYDAPANRSVARFIGQPPMALLPCTVLDAGPDRIGIEPVDARLGAPWLVPRRSAAGLVLAGRAGHPVALGLRAEHVQIAGLGIPLPDQVTAVATVDRVELVGHEAIATLRLGPYTLAARVDARSSLRTGEVVAVALDLDHASWFDPATGDRLGGPVPAGRPD